MSFIELDFVRFMVIVFTLYWGCEAVSRAPLRGLLLRAAGVFGARARLEARIDDLPRVLQNVLLVVASCVFYGWIHWWFLVLMFFSAGLDYFAGIYIEDHPEKKKRALIASLVGNLGLLGTFKYYDWFVWNVGEVLSWLGFQPNLPFLRVMLPIGISFYTFQSIAYTVDVYRGQLKARRNLLEYAVFVTMFSQLVAGPIQRATSLLPQVERPRRFSVDQTISGLGLALWGAFKKVCIADTLAPYVDEVFMTKEPAFVMVLAAGFAFGVQMLADFSGYTDIARGTARMLGFHLTENFNRPYAALSTPDFWRRWHISLSSWVGDYVYTPLLRSGRPGPGRTVFAMMVTFFLVGLWHGASWNFIVLGLYNGLWMAIYTFTIPIVPRWARENLPLQFCAWLFHTLVVLQPTGLLFREVSLARVWQHLTQPWFAATQEELVAATIVGSMALLGTLPMNLSFWVEDHVLPRLRQSTWFLPVQTTFWSVEVLAIFVFYRDATQDFIYFQF